MNGIDYRVLLHDLIDRISDQTTLRRAWRFLARHYSTDANEYQRTKREPETEDEGRLYI